MRHLFARLSYLLFCATGWLSCRHGMDPRYFIEHQKSRFGGWSFSITRDVPFDISLTTDTGKKLTSFKDLAEGYTIQHYNGSRFKMVISDVPLPPKSALRPPAEENDTLFCIKKSMNFHKCDISLEENRFDQPAHFLFFQPVAFSQCHFSMPDKSDRLPLSSSIFYGSVLFNENIFDERPSCVGDTFCREVTIQNRFSLPNPPAFMNCAFYKGLCFTSGTLIYNKDGGCLHIKKDLLFSNCLLFGNLDLSYCAFDGAKLQLDGTFLPDTLDLSNTQLSVPIDLTHAYPNLRNNLCEINLLNTEIDKIKMQYQFFHLYIPDSILHNPFASDLVNKTYEMLLNNFKINGLTGSYEKLDKEYQDWQSESNWSLKLSGIWWRYGYDKWLVLLWTSGFILLFSFINYYKYALLQSAYPVEKLLWGPAVPLSFRSGLKKYLTTLIYTSLIFFRLNIDFRNIHFGRMRYGLLILLQYTVGLLCTGFLLNWILKG